MSRAIYLSRKFIKLLCSLCRTAYQCLCKKLKNKRNKIKNLDDILAALIDTNVMLKLKFVAGFRD